MASGKSVRLFLADGTPGGLVTAEIMNWTGHVIAAPRSDLPSLLKRKEVTRTGVYILLGDDPESPGRSLAYVGEGDDVGKRVVAHARSETQGGKDFWDRVIVLTSKDMNLTKAHARYLESRLIHLAAEAKRARLVNGTAPPPVPLPEADESDMEFFIEQARIVLPVLQVNLLRSAKIPPQNQGTRAHGLSDDSPLFVLVSKKAQISATAREVDGEFTVMEGSGARSTWIAKDHNYRKLREQLEQDGTIAIDPASNAMVFTRDHVFDSPSAASACVLGRNSNGRLEWRVQGSAMSYGAWQESQLSDVMGVED